MKNIKQELFELVSSIGESIIKKIHIIDISDSDSDCEENQKFRIYHKDGYCFDVIKEVKINNDLIEIEYSMYSDYDEFIEINTNKAIELITLNNKL